MAVTIPRERRRAAPGSDVSGPVVAPLVVWSALVAAGALLVYLVLVASGRKRLDAAPLHGAFDPHLTIGLLGPLLVAAVALIGVRALVRLPWRRLLLVVGGGALVWTVALASVRGARRLAAPFDRPQDYLAVLDRIESMPRFLDTFVERIAQFPVHVQGHPPGFVVVTWLLRGVGLADPGTVAALCVVVGAASAPLALITVREVAGEGWARRAAPFVVVTPAALWIGASADAFFAGVGALSVALLVVATGRRGRRGVVLGFAGGVVLGITVFLSYGLALLGVIPVVVAWHRRRAAPVLAGAMGASLVVAGFAGAGFWWIDGLQATRVRYLAGIASDRPYALFLVANLSILAIALGPAVAVGIARLRDARLWLVVGGAVLAVAIADLSGMSKSEVERIWLPFMPFLLVAAAAVVPAGAAVTRPPAAARAPSMALVRGLLACQAGVAIAIEGLIRTAW